MRLWCHIYSYGINGTNLLCGATPSIMLPEKVLAVWRVWLNWHQTGQTVPDACDLAEVNKCPGTSGGGHASAGVTDTSQWAAQLVAVAHRRHGLSDACLRSSLR